MSPEQVLALATIVADLRLQLGQATADNAALVAEVERLRVSLPEETA